MDIDINAAIHGGAHPNHLLIWMILQVSWMPLEGDVWYIYASYLPGFCSQCFKQSAQAVKKLTLHLIFPEKTKSKLTDPQNLKQPSTSQEPVKVDRFSSWFPVFRLSMRPASSLRAHGRPPQSRTWQCFIWRGKISIGKFQKTPRNSAWLNKKCWRKKSGKAVNTM